jgi:hypothetical protein
LWGDETSTKLELLALQGTHSQHSFSLSTNGLNKGAKVTNFKIWLWSSRRMHERPQFIGRWREAGVAAPVHPAVPPKIERQL